jgi:hypothetical protein
VCDSDVAVVSSCAEYSIVLDTDTLNRLSFYARRRKEPIEKTTVEMIKAGLDSELSQLQEDE